MNRSKEIGLLLKEADDLIDRAQFLYEEDVAEMCERFTHHGPLKRESLETFIAIHQ